MSGIARSHPHGEESIRAFVAVELPEAVRGELEAAQAWLRQEVVSGVRWVAPGGIHLTLKFLGNIPGSRVAQIGQALREVAERELVFDLALGSLGVFPPRGSPRVVWVGLAAEVERLFSLQQRVEGALEELGFEHEKRAFRPHLTLGRVREDASAATKAQLIRCVAEKGYQPKPVAFRVEGVSLVQSFLHPSGASYRCLVVTPLRAA